jgi:hypothetical protein
MGAVASATSSEQAIFCYRCQQTRYTPRLPRTSGSSPVYVCPTCSSDFIQVAIVYGCVHLHSLCCEQLVEDDSNVRLSRPRPNPDADRRHIQRLRGDGSARVSSASLFDDDGAAGAPPRLHLRPLGLSTIGSLLVNPIYVLSGMQVMGLSQRQLLQCCSSLQLPERSDPWRTLFLCCSPCK